MLAFGDVPLPRGQARVVYAVDDHRPGCARGGDRARPGPRLRRGDRGAGGRAERHRGARLGLDGSLAAIVALQGPTSRFDAKVIAAAVPLLVACAERISVALGWHE